MPRKIYVILRSARRARLEGRTALLQHSFAARRGLRKGAALSSEDLRLAGDGGTVPVSGCRKPGNAGRKK
jgi:hypothetical protein